MNHIYAVAQTSRHKCKQREIINVKRNAMLGSAHCERRKRTFVWRAVTVFNLNGVACVRLRTLPSTRLRLSLAFGFGVARQIKPTFECLRNSARRRWLHQTGSPVSSANRSVRLGDQHFDRQNRIRLELIVFDAAAATAYGRKYLHGVIFGRKTLYGLEGK